MSATAVPGECQLFIEPPLARVVLSNPTKRNAIQSAMWDQLATFIEQATADKSVTVVLIEGQDGHFASGADIGEFDELTTSRAAAAAFADRMARALQTVERCPKPVIAKIEGTCVGAGCSIALACDLRFASANTRFGITPSKLGLVYSIADTRRLIATVGLPVAKDLLFSGRLLSATDALALGLCDRVEDAASFHQTVLDYCGLVASNAPWSLAATKQIMAMLSEGRPDDDAEARDVMIDSFSNSDFLEGLKAFRERRNPVFKRDGSD